MICPNIIGQLQENFGELCCIESVWGASAYPSIVSHVSLSRLFFVTVYIAQIATMGYAKHAATASRHPLMRDAGSVGGL